MPVLGSREKAAAFLLCGGLMGCDTSVSVGGTVRSVDGAPVPAASAELRCPGRPDLDNTVQAGRDGGFRFPMRVGCLDSDCVVTVTTPDGRSSRHQTEKYCVKRDRLCGKSCSTAEMNVVH